MHNRAPAPPHSRRGAGAVDSSTCLGKNVGMDYNPDWRVEFRLQNRLLGRLKLAGEPALALHAVILLILEDHAIVALHFSPTASSPAELYNAAKIDGANAIHVSGTHCAAADAGVSDHLFRT